MMKVKMSKKSKSLSRGIKEGYRSGLEETLGLDLRIRGVKHRYEPFKIGYKKPESDHNYTPDFILEVSSIIIETKGRFTLEDRKKHLLIKEQWPNLDIRFIFSNPKNKLRKGSPTTYAMWCNKHGFKYSKKVIPEEWLNE